MAYYPNKRSRAKHWIKEFSPAATETVIATVSAPGTITTVLGSLEGTMCYEIGQIYRPGWSLSDAQAAANTVGLGAFSDKTIALRATPEMGPLEKYLKPVLAAEIVKDMGKLVIRYFEEDLP